MKFKIIVPEGMEIDRKHSTFECIVFKSKEAILPKTWQEVGKISGWYISQNSKIIYIEGDEGNSARNIYPTKELAEASLALCQLLQLRDRYNNGWVPDWSDETVKCVIGMNNKVTASYKNYHLLAFKTRELRGIFFENFKDLLEIAKPLL